MDTVLRENTQQALIPGECVDIYYANKDTTKKQCFPTTVNTRFVQNFASLGSGVNTFTIPAGVGYQDVVIQLQLPTLSSNTGLAVPRGWGYALVKQISYRVGGSSQYFLSGAQMLQEALRSCPNAQARDDLFSLGGSQLIEANLNSTNNYAYVWLKLPWTMPSSTGKPVPIPSDLLTSQIQITVELNPLSSVFTVESTNPSPTALQSAQFQVQQVVLANAQDQLARRVDMTTHSLSMPVDFLQQEIAIPLTSNTGIQTVSATGFRSGLVKGINCWITKGSDTGSVVLNPLKWYALSDLQLTYAGEVFARYDAGSYQLWNLVNSRESPKVSGSTISYASSTFTGTADSYYWSYLPFAQAYDDGTATDMLVSGKSITNGIVQIQVKTPTADTDYVLHVSYVYNSVIVYTQGSCDFVF